jgi:HTH-like domain
VARPVPGECRESVRAGRRPTTPGPVRTRKRAAQEPGPASSPWSSKKARRSSDEARPLPQGAARNVALLERIRALKADHPFWGYRRIWAYLRYVDGLIVNQKRVYNVMKAADLLVRPNLKLRARRKAATTKPRPTRPNDWWGIDMTKVMIEGSHGLPPKLGPRRR